MAATMISFLAGCWPNRRIVFLAEDLPGTRAIRRVAKETFGEDDQVEFVLDPYEQMVLKSNTDFASKTGNYDVVLQYNAALANYVSNNYVVPIGEFADRNWANALSQKLFLKSWKEIGWYQSSTQEQSQPFGVPFAANSMLLCCNRSLFESTENRSRFQRAHKHELEPPKTWEQFETVAKFFTDDKTRGVALQGAPYWIYYEWANFAFGNGGGLMRKTFGWQSNPNTPLILASAPTVEATERYLRLKKYSQFAQTNADFFATDAGQQVQLMKSDRYAMAIMWSDVAYDLVGGQYWSKDFTFHVIPGNVSMLAGGSYYINRQSKSVRRSTEIIKKLLEPDQQAKLALQGLCSPLRELYSDKRLTDVIPYFAAVGESLQRGVYMLEAGPDADQIMQIMSRVLQGLFKANESIDLSARLAAAQEEIAQARSKLFKLKSQH